MESLPLLSGGRALSSDMLCRNSEEPACRGGVLPDASTGKGPGTLASFAHRNDFSREGGNAVTVTNNLPILSVLAFRAILKNYYRVAFKDKQ